MDDKILTKWKVLIQACTDYYINCVPTGLQDSEYDTLEELAIKEDNFYVRDYVLTKYLKGTRTENKRIEKFKKEKVTGSMVEALRPFIKDDYYLTLKYDGASIAIYPDPNTGIVQRVVTVGNVNLSSFGIDQTYKLLKFLPRFPKGIEAIQCEALIDLSRLPEGIDPEKARQKTNGLINSKDRQEEVDQLLTLRAYRYYTVDSPAGKAIDALDYKEVLNSFSTVYAPDGHIWFAPAEIYQYEDLGAWAEIDRTTTSTGTFLNDGWVIYSKSGICQGARKYAGAGASTEMVTSKVLGIKWNDKSKTGKDSFSANILIEPTMLHGEKVTKPTAGSVSKMYKNNTTPGAKVSIILANSTIPQIGATLEPGNGDFMWPTCDCGYSLDQKDIFGTGLKCGNPECTSRISRMKKYLESLPDIADLDPNILYVVDRFAWKNWDREDTIKLLEFVEQDDVKSFIEYHYSKYKYNPDPKKKKENDITALQKKNLDLVLPAVWKSLREIFLWRSRENQI